MVLLGWWESRRRSSRPTRPSRRCKATKKTGTCWQPRVLFDNLYGYLLLVTFSQELRGNLVYYSVLLSWCNLQVDKWNGTPILITLGLSPSWLRLRNLYLQQCILFTGVPSCCRLSFPFLSFVKSKCHGQARTAAHYQGERMKKAKEAVPWRSQWSFAAFFFCFPVASGILNSDQTKMWLVPTICELLNMARWLPRKIVAAQWLWNEITWNQPTPLESLVNRSLHHHHETIPKHTGSAPTEAAKET